MIRHTHEEVALKAAETFAVVRAFMKAFACVIAQIDDMPPRAKTTTFAIQLLEELGSTELGHFTDEQVELYDSMLGMLKNDIAEAVENREILKNPH